MQTDQRVPCTWGRLLGWFVFALGLLNSVSGKEPSPLSRQLKALADCENHSKNFAVLLRMQFNKLAADASESTSYVQNVMGIRSSGRIAGESGKELWFKSSFCGGMSQTGEFSVQKSSELFATVGNRVFAGNKVGVNGEEVRDEFIVRELTEQIDNDEAFKEYADKTLKELQVDPLALPFLSIDSIIGRDVGFSRIREIMRNWEVEYDVETEESVKVVWVGSKRNAVATYFLDSDVDYLPTKICIYTRPVTEKGLDAADSLGELLYRTTTQWTQVEAASKFKSKSRLQPGQASESIWLPKRIVLEEAPKTELHVLEIDCQWKLDIDPNLVSPEALLGNTVPNPISDLYHELSTKMDEMLLLNHPSSRR